MAAAGECTKTFHFPMNTLIPFISGSLSVSPSSEKKKTSFLLCTQNRIVSKCAAGKGVVRTVNSFTVLCSGLEHIQPAYAQIPSVDSVTGSLSHQKPSIHRQLLHCDSEDNPGEKHHPLHFQRQQEYPMQMRLTCRSFHRDENGNTNKCHPDWDEWDPPQATRKDPHPVISMIRSLIGYSSCFTVKGHVKAVPWG